MQTLSTTNIVHACAFVGSCTTFHYQALVHGMTRSLHCAV